MCTPQKYKTNLSLAKDKVNQTVLANRRKSTANRTTGWQSWEEAILPLLCRRVPYSLSRDSNSQQLPELTNPAPSPLISSVARAARCHKNTFRAARCFQPVPLPGAPCFFQPFPTSSALHTQLSWKQARSLAFPERNLPTFYCPGLRSWTTSTIQTYLEVLHPHHLPQPRTKCTEKPSAILFITDVL